MQVVRRRVGFGLWAVLAASMAWGCGGASAAPQPPATPSAQDAPEPRPSVRADGRLPHTATPQKSALRLELDPAQSGFRGQTTIALRFDRPLAHVVLHASALRITRAQLGGQAAEVQLDGDVLTVSLPAPLPAGEHALQLDFEGDYSLELDGIYRAGNAVYTDFEPIDARKAFPCFDEPAFKVPYDVRVRVPKGQLAFGNARELRREEQGEHTEFVFATTRPLPSYLVAVTAGKLVAIEGEPAPSRGEQKSVPVRVIAQEEAVRDRSRAAGALRVARETLPLFESWFDVPYPYDKVDLVAVPNFAAGAMENAGLITFREERLLVHPEKDARRWQRSMAVVLVHELAHQWFGNLVTTAWWNDIWLNEGFASFMEGEILDAWRPSFGARLDRVIEGQRTMELDALPSARRVRQPVNNAADAREAFDPITYDKGAMLLAMVQGWMGPDALRAAIGRYLRAHADGNASSDQLFAELDAAGPIAGRPTSEWLSPWLEQPGVPWLSAQPQRVQAWRPRGAAPRAGSWPVPVCHVPGVCAEFGAAPAQPGEVRFGTLYARGSVSLGATDSAADALAQQWNLWAEVRGGDGDALEALEAYAKYTTETLKRAPSRHVLESLLMQSSAWAPALLGTPRGEALRGTLRAALWPLWQKSRTDAAASDDEVLSRRALAYLLVDVAGDARVAKQLTEALRGHLRGKSLPVDEQMLAFELGPRAGDAALWQALHNRWQKAESAAERVGAQNALFGFDDRAQLTRSLELLRQGELPAQDVLYALRVVSARPALAVWFNEWLGQHFEALRAHYLQGVMSRATTALGGLCDEAELAKVMGGYPQAVARIDGGARSVELSQQAVRACVQLRSALGGGAAAPRTK